MTTTSERDSHRDPDPLIGTLVAGYRIESLIGQGGMGVVYRATELHTGSPAAVKVMVPEIARNPEFRERFTREAESGIDHPNIVPIYRAGEADGLLYIAMRLIEGEDLKSVIGREGRLLPTRVVSIFTQAASALDAAHENGVVHRDVKPQNILIEPGSEADFELVYLSDFGLVKRVSSQSSFTTSTYLMGSVQYMAPEQIEGKRVDGRSDVYSLGCVLHEALTGSVPFHKETEVAVLWAHMNEDPPPVSSKVPVLGTAVDSVIGKAMAKSPDDRYLTAGEMTSALALELGISTGRVRSPWAAGIASTGGRRRMLLRRRPQSVADRMFPKPVSRFRAALVGGLATLLALGGASLVNLNGSTADEPSSLDVIRALESPHAPGSQEILKEAEGKLPGIGRRDPAGLGLPLAAVNRAPRGGSIAEGPGGATGMGLSGTAVTQPGGQRSQPGTSGSATAEEVTPLGAAILFTSQRGPSELHNGIYAMDPDGSNLRVVFNGAGDEFEPVLSPGRRRIAFSCGRSLCIVNVDGTGLRQLTRGVLARDPVWSPDGTKIAYSSNPKPTNPSPTGWEIHVIPADGSGSPINLTNNVEFDRYPDWSPDGKRIAFTRDYAEYDLFVMDADGSDATRLTQAPLDFDYEADWSPDGTRIAFSRDVYQGGTSAYWTTDLFVVNVASREVTKILDWPRWVATSPDWSPDGKKIVFWADFFRSEADLGVMRADGKGEVKRLTRHHAWDYDPTWD